MSRWTKAGSGTKTSIWKQPTSPTLSNGIQVGDLWIDINTHLLKQCSSTSPLTWVIITGSSAYDSLSLSTLATNKVVATDASHNLIATPISADTLNYLAGATSSIQTQLNSKEPLLGDAIAEGSTKGKSTFTANDFNSSAGVVSIDYTNGQKATASQPGFLTSTDWATFNNKASVKIYPQVRAYRSSNQTISSGSATKIQFNAESWDTNAAFDNSSNYRFQPTVAGKYSIQGIITLQVGVSVSSYSVSIYRNGSAFSSTQGFISISLSSTTSLPFEDVVDLNGSTDYVEIFLLHSSVLSTSQTVLGGVYKSYMNCIALPS